MSATANSAEDVAKRACEIVARRRRRDSAGHLYHDGLWRVTKEVLAGKRHTDGDVRDLVRFANADEDLLLRARSLIASSCEKKIANWAERLAEDAWLQVRRAHREG